MCTCRWETRSVLLGTKWPQLPWLPKGPLSLTQEQGVGGTMAQTDVLLTKEPTPQAVPACELPQKVYDVARNVGACSSSGLATAGFRSAKYLADEWSQNCYARYHQAFADRNQSERRRHESHQLAAKTQALARCSQEDATRKAGARLQDTHGWKSELQREVGELGTESDLLLAQKQRLARALDATSVPFSIATDNLQCRERRQHPDLVRDCVETELLKVRGPFRSQTQHARRPPPSPGSVTCTGPGWAGSRGPRCSCSRWAHAGAWAHTQVHTRAPRRCVCL